MSKHKLGIATRQAIWQALRISTPLTLHELSMLTDKSSPTIRVILNAWNQAGLLNAVESQPRRGRYGRPPLVYSLIDRTVVNPPTYNPLEIL